MKKAVLIVLLQVMCSVGFSVENSRFTFPLVIHIPANANLDVRWNAPTNKLPSNIWIYRLLPRKLSSQMLSNLMVACSFSSHDATTNGDLIICKSADGNRELRVSWPWGVIDYNALLPRSPTNLVKDVPTEKQAIRLTKKLLPKLGINLSDIDKKENSSEPDFHAFEMPVTYFVGTNSITNIESCEVRFRRAVDGIEFISIGSGGEGDIHFGAHGDITQMLITWRNMERKKSYRTFTPEMMIKSIRDGKAIQEGIPAKFGEIDWRTVKRVTIKKVQARYFAGYDRFAPSDWLQPYASLWATVERPDGTMVDCEIDCPIYESETR